MVFLILALLLIIAGILVYKLLDEYWSILVFVIAAFSLVVGLFANFTGYEKPTICNEYALIPLVEDTNGYVIQAVNNRKMCKYQVVSEHDKTVKKEIIKSLGTGVEIEYINEDSRPVLREYVEKSKKTIWDGICADDRIYSVLFVPEAYIVK